MLVNNTSVWLHEMGTLQAIRHAIQHDGGELPEDLADLFVLTHTSEGNWILDWA